MIQTEYLKDGKLIRHYSDKGVMLLQVETGVMYSDPIDVVPCQYIYEETDVLIEEEVQEKVKNPDEATIEDYQDALSEFGVEV